MAKGIRHSASTKPLNISVILLLLLLMGKSFRSFTGVLEGHSHVLKQSSLMSAHLSPWQNSSFHVSCYSISILHPSHFCTYAFDFPWYCHLRTAEKCQAKQFTSGFFLPSYFSCTDTGFFLLKEEHTAHFCTHRSLAEFSSKQLTEC